MNRRKIMMIAIVAMSIIGFNACNNESTDTGASTSEVKTTASVQYTCPMHLEVVSDKPGDCPKCGMILVEKTGVNTTGSDTSEQEQHDSTRGH